MLKPTDELLIFGVIVILACIWAVVVPYIRRRNDLMTPTNFFLGGALVFVGVSAIDSAVNPWVLVGIYDYTREDYRSYILMASAFFLAFYVAHRHLRRTAGTIANRMFVKWPPVRRDVLTFMIFMAVLFSFGVVFRPPIVGLAQIIFHVATKATAIAIVIAFLAWHRDRANPFWQMALLGCFVLAIVMGVMSGGGRRTILSAMVALPIAWYWVIGRNRIRPITVLAWLSVIGVSLFFVISAYSLVRRSGKAQGNDRDWEFSYRIITKFPERFGEIPWGQMLGQRAVECSLAAGRRYRDEQYDNLFHSLKFLACAPIPRQLWNDPRDKPEGLGRHLPRDIRARTRATWGPGIVGHGYYEGGIFVIIVYGLMAGLAFRVLDEIVYRNAQNPYVLGIFAAVSGNVIGWLRGDIATFTIQIISGVMAGLVLAYIGRFLYGSETPKVFQYDPRQIGSLARR